MMVICHLKYRKKNPELAAQSKFRMPLFPVMNYIILAFFVFILGILALNEDTRIALFIEMAGVKEIYKKSKKEDSDDYII